MTNTISKKSKISKRRWNLIILGVSSILIAVTTTCVSLLIYHNSGDIYLDRSRPGYLPEEGEIDSAENEEIKFILEKSGKLDMGVLEEYLEQLDLEIKAIDSYDKLFGQSELSNERLGIPAE